MLVHNMDGSSVVQFAIVGMVSVLVLFVLERCLHVFLTLIASVIFSSESATTYPAMQAVGSMVSVVTSVLSSLMGVIGQLFSSLFSILILWLVMFLCASVFFLVYEEVPGVFRKMCMQWNDYLGPVLYLRVVYPVRFLQLGFEHVLPIFNAWVGFIRNAFLSSFTTALFQAGSGALALAQSSGQMFAGIATSSVSFGRELHTRVNDCESLGLNCFEIVSLDLAGPLALLPAVTMNLVSIFLGSCPVLQAPVDLLLYPLMDPNLGLAIDNFVNWLISVFIELPRVTAQRCRLHKDKGGIGLMMCVPDVRMVTDRLVHGIRLVGTMFDNWLDMSLVIIERTFRLNSTDCDLMDVRGDLSISLAAFGGNLTVMTAITSSVFTVTDGTSIQYFDTGRAMQVVTSPLGEGWPIEVDVTFGVAVVSLPGGLDSEGQSTGLLGCRCDDVGGKMAITCAVAPHYGATALTMPKHVFPVEFQVATTASKMSCGGSKISVQSIRWPVTRYTSLTPNVEILTVGRVDAAVWVMPMCPSDFAAIECMKMSTVTSCYPYCMALHERGTMSQKLVLFSSREWADYVHLLGRDCTMTKLKFGELPEMPDALGQPLRENSTLTIVANGVMGNSVEEADVTGGGLVSGCEANPLARSLVPVLRHEAYYKESTNSIRMENQPFVFAGDTALVGEYGENGEGPHSVSVYRLSGNSRSEYTMIKTKKSMPANPPLDILSDMDEDKLNELDAEAYDGYETDRLTLPYQFSDTGFANNAAVQTEDALFFSMNPSVRMFKALFDFCAGGNVNEPPQAQISVLSKYHPLFVTKISPYGRSDDLNAQTIFFKSGNSLADVYTTGIDCNQRFDLAITSLEYMDSQNIAVTIMSTTLKGASSLDRSQSEYRLEYIHPRSMKNNTRPWSIPPPSGETSSPPWLPVQPSDSGVRLCPAMRRMPNIGSMMSELWVGLVIMVRYVPEVICGFVGLVPVWKEMGAVCPMISFGHSQLQRCGGELLALDDLFLALDTANRHFWRSLSFIAEFVVSSDKSTKNTLNGMNYFGSAFLPPFVYGSQQMVVQLFRLPVMDKVSDMSVRMLQVKPSPLFQMAAQFKTVAQQASGTSHFVSRLMNNIIMGIVPHAVHGDAGMALRSVWLDIYDSGQSLDDLVFPSVYQGCAGLSIMLGYNNPWAAFLRKICEASVPMVQGPFRLASALMVDVAFTGCLCVHSAGHNFREYAMSNCMRNAPRHLQPLIIEWLQFGNEPLQTCQAMRELMQRNVRGAMDPLFEKLMDASSELGGAVDYLRSVLDDQAGQCLNFETDPFVVAMIPHPVDYFRGCARTTMCEGRCRGEIEQFEELVSLTSVRPEETFSKRVRSLFFVGDDKDSRCPFRIVLSLVEISPCSGTCVGRCVAVFGIEWDGVASVRRYCVPLAPGQGVYMQSRWEVVDSIGTDRWSMGRIFGSSGSSVIVVSIDETRRLAYARENSRGGEVIHWLPYLVSSGVRQIVHVHTHAGLVLIRMLSSVDGVNKLDSLCVRCMGNEDPGSCKSATVCVGSGGGDTDFFLVSEGKSVVWVETNTGAVDALLFPMQASEEAQTVVRVRMEGVQVKDIKKVGEVRAFGHAAGVSSTHILLMEQETAAGGNSMVLSQNVFEKFEGSTSLQVFSTDKPSAVANWLSNVEVDLGKGGAFRRYSQEAIIGVSVAQKCDRTSCSGCTSLEVQRVCYAMEQCMVAKCVGTLVNQKHPLCAMGLTIENLMAYSVQNMRAFSTIATDTAAQVLGLGFGDTEVHVEWPDDAFFSLMCTAKDATATATSTLTATVNNFVQTAMNMPLEYSQTGAVHVDGNMRAVMTMVFTALNNLLFQAALAPLYSYIVLQKIIVCEANSLLAFTDVLGMSVFIGDRELQQDIGNTLGVCLPERSTTDITELKQVGVTDKIALVASELLATLEHSVSNLVMVSITTVVDAVFSWFVGVLRGIGDVAQTVDMAHCKMPDFYMTDVYTCACGDEAMEIVSERSKEGVGDSAFWCSGTLEMMSSSGQPIIVFNKYSMDELTNAMKAQDIDRYLVCVSRPVKFKEMYPGLSGQQCEQLKPRLFDIERQGVDTVSVWGRCRANYNVREWDPGAYGLFKDDMFFSGVTREMRLNNEDVSTCLLKSHALGQGPNACMIEFLGSLGMTRQVYFAYRVSETQGSTVHTDACRVFSGPAKTGESVFKECLDEYADEGCQIAPFVWSARSNNRVPVASEHIIKLSDTEKLNTANSMIQQAHVRAMRALNSVTNYNNSRLEAYLFSVEGDVIHQMMDCAVMGAMDRLDMWPDASSLPVPSWWRSENGRDIPDCGAAGLGTDESPFDDNFPPFTCGSPSRRGVMKYFIRDFLSDKGSSLVVDAVNKQINEQIAIWQDIDKYQCSCPSGSAYGTNSYECCKAGDDDSFTPLEFRKGFDEIPSKILVDTVAGNLELFWEEMKTSIDPWWKWVRKVDSDVWNWNDVERIIASEAGLHSTTKPLLFYNESDVRGPFNNGTESLWDMCTGLLSQGMSSLPLAHNGSGWFLRDIDKIPVLIRGKEAEFVKNVFKVADAYSPLQVFHDWRHVPSDSAVCQKHRPVGRASVLSPGKLKMKPMYVSHDDETPWGGDQKSIIQEYSTPGSYEYIVPENTKSVEFHLWGAGGAGAVKNRDFIDTANCFKLVVGEGVHMQQV